MKEIEQLNILCILKKSNLLLKLFLQGDIISFDESSKTLISKFDQNVNRKEKTIGQDLV